jgi:hypothetical protein
VTPRLEEALLWLALAACLCAVAFLAGAIAHELVRFAVAGWGFAP